MTTCKLVILVLLIILPLYYAQQCTSTPLPLCDSATCGYQPANAFFLPNNTACKPCSESDYASRFTDCENNQKSLFYYWKPPATCRSSAQVSSLPAPIHGIDCAATCVFGNFFNTTSRTCQPCAAGSFASNGYIVVDEFYSLPNGFSTRCEVDVPGAPCFAWAPRGDYIDSGSNNFLTSLRSILEYRATLTVAATSYIQFDYQYITDNTDERLTFSANQYTQTLTSSSTWKTVTIRLPVGTYLFSWSIKRGTLLYRSNTARLRNIEIGGFGAIDTRCTPCEAGTYASDSSRPCKACKSGTFAPTTGSATCTSCPQFYNSTAGASTCTLLPYAVCKASDYFFDRSSCVPGTTYSVAAKWIEPRLCFPEHPSSIALNVTSTPELCPQLDCAKYYQIRNAAGTACQYCPRGYRANPNTNSCEKCPLGTGTRNQFIIDKFYNSTLTRMGLTTGCFGDCGRAGGGWRLVGDYMDSGLAMGAAVSFVRLPVTIRPGNNATVQLSLTVSCPAGSAEFLVTSFAFVPLLTIPCSGCSTVQQFVSVEIPESELAVNRFINLAFRRTSELVTENAACDKVTITKVNVIGTDAGGTDACYSCPSGTSPDNNCQPCAAGTYSNLESCVACPSGTFSVSMSTTCASCLTGMNATGSGDSCYWLDAPCVVQADLGSGVSKTFNYQNVTNWLKGRSFFAAGDAVSRYFFNLDGTPTGSLCGSRFACSISSDGAIRALADTGSVVGLSETNAVGLRMNLFSLHSTCNGNQQIKTTIDLVCNPGATTTLVSIEQPSTCAVNARITSAGMCPECVEDDFYLYKSVCVDSKRTIQWMKKPDALHWCIGGVTKPSNITIEDCYTEIVVAAQPWVAILVVALVLLALVVVAGLIGLAVFCFIRYRQLSNRFALLPDAPTELNTQTASQ